MRTIIATAISLLCAVSFAQSLKDSKEALATMIHSANTGTRIFRDGHHTRDSAKTLWDEQASQGLPIALPNLLLSSNSAVGHIGVLPDGTIGYDLIINYKVLRQTEDGTLVIVQHDTPSSISSLGPFLFKNAPTKSIPTNGFFEPKGTWQISGIKEVGGIATLIVEPLPDSEFRLPDSQPHKFQFKHLPRDWENIDKTSFARGIYIGYRSGKVWIMDGESKILKKGIFELSKSDQGFVRKEIKDGRRDHLIPEYLGETAEKRAK